MSIPAFDSAAMTISSVALRCFYETSYCKILPWPHKHAILFVQVQNLAQATWYRRVKTQCEEDFWEGSQIRERFRLRNTSHKKFIGQNSPTFPFPLQCAHQNSSWTIDRNAYTGTHAYSCTSLFNICKHLHEWKEWFLLISSCYTPCNDIPCCS